MVVLGIDSAWTTRNPSGLGLLVGGPGRWRCLHAGRTVTPATTEDWRALLTAAAAQAGEPLTVAAVDMPLAREPITGRRACDNAIARAFGNKGCGVHSSTPERPGRVSTHLMAALNGVGLTLATQGDRAGPGRALEVYPHIAVMHLLGESYRVPYKIARAGKYWPEKTPTQRRAAIRRNLLRILDALTLRLGPIPLARPPAAATPKHLKEFEDTLDGVVCAWVGAQFLDGRCDAYGDGDGAIWVTREGA